MTTAVDFIQTHHSQKVSFERIENNSIKFYARIEQGKELNISIGISYFDISKVVIKPIMTIDEIVENIVDGYENINYISFSIDGKELR